MGKLCFNQNRGVYEWVHVNPTSSVIDVDNVAYELSHDPLRPEMRVPAEALTSAARPCPIACENCCHCIDIGGGGQADPSTDPSAGPDKNGDGQLSPQEAADALENIIDMSTGELEDSSVFREYWTSL